MIGMNFFLTVYYIPYSMLSDRFDTNYETLTDLQLTKNLSLWNGARHNFPKVVIVRHLVFDLLYKQLWYLVIVHFSENHWLIRLVFDEYYMQYNILNI